MKNYFAFTHWACFDCRKSFAKEPVAKDMGARKCPQCATSMTDMGAYFEPPRKLNKKRWAAMKVLADYGYKFRSEGMKFHIEKAVLGVRTPNADRLREQLELGKKERIEEKIKQRLSWEKKFWKKQKS